MLMTTKRNVLFSYKLSDAGFQLEVCTAAGVTGTLRARRESTGMVTERTGDPWYRVTNCTGSPWGGGTLRSHTACSARTASASLQRPNLYSLHSVPTPPSVKCELSTDQATGHCTNRSHAPNDATDTIL